ncbi:hypothetical protein QUG92_05005 [Curtobacterium sp. RHCKG23]|uniref:Uncharacterized protein n=1 Tax=Curtobacterium citri TaxID=3055139 RepID=A0ABT7T4F2_9MICO|nr:hypothetical protein [Curtobacterium citri]MDM7884456.1 hypothetical protein [Curtobacterium citri]
MEESALDREGLVSPRREPEVVRDHEDRRPGVREFLQRTCDALRSDLVEGGGRFVDESDCRSGRDQPCDRDTLVLTPGQVVGPTAPAPLEPDPIERSFGPSAPVPPAAEPIRERHVVQDGERRNEIVRLEDDADCALPVASVAASRMRPEVSSGDADAPG